MRPKPHPHPRYSQGLSIVEFMIAMAIGMALLAGVIAIFVSNSNTRQEIEKTSRQIENGRYALQLITDDLKMAGYLGEFVPDQDTDRPNAAAPIPDPCATDDSEIAAAVVLHVQGFDSTAVSPSCITDQKAGTDVIVIRRTATCTSINPLEAGCDAPIAGTPYLQVGYPASATPASCTETTTTRIVSSNTGNLTLNKIGCTSPASARRLLTHIYFIANNNISGDGIPTLKRAELTGGAFVVVPLAEGIEQLQFEYGIDNAPAAPAGDGVPDTMTATPTTITDWWNVMTVKTSLIARNEKTSGDYLDKKQYQLGGESFGPFNDQYRRSVFSSSVTLANPIGRRQP